MDITVFLGAPGSGKGTQAKKLTTSGKFVHFSTGDMLRAAIAAGTPLGKSAKAVIDKGDLVSDDIMIGLIEEALASVPKSTKVILDGFPRTVPQALALDSKMETKVDRAIYFQVPEKILLERLTGRRLCKSCGQSYHVVHIKPKKEGVCDNCGGPLYQRPDDSENVVKNRLDVFAKQTSVLLDYFSKKKNLVEINADQATDKVQYALLELLH